MDLFFDPSRLLLSVIGIALLILKVYAFVDCLRRPDAPFVAYGKLTKPAWLAITGISALLELLSGSPLRVWSLLGTVASIVYLVDVKPAVTGAANPWD